VSWAMSHASPAPPSYRSWRVRPCGSPAGDAAPARVRRHWRRRFDGEALPGEEARALRDSLLLIDGALSALDTAQRAAFVLIELEGMTLDQVAAALEMSPRMASAQLNQARAKFDLAARRLMEASERRARA
jgi:DNA-directed RNA polymerase specialized sigma24 family protein